MAEVHKINILSQVSHLHERVPEAVLESPRHKLEGAHAASTGSLSALSFLAPLIRAQLCCRVAALGTCWCYPREIVTQGQINYYDSQGAAETHSCVAYGMHGHHNAGRACGTWCVSYCTIKMQPHERDKID